MVSWAPIYSEKWCDLTWPCICLKFNFHQARKISTGGGGGGGGGGGVKIIISCGSGLHGQPL